MSLSEIDPQTFLTYNSCFAKTPKMLIKHGYIDRSPVPARKISSYRAELSRFATAVSNANFVEKHGLVDYFKLCQHSQMLKSFDKPHVSPPRSHLIQGEFQLPKAVSSRKDEPTLLPQEVPEKTTIRKDRSATTLQNRDITELDMHERFRRNQNLARKRLQSAQHPVKPQSDKSDQQRDEVISVQNFNLSFSDVELADITIALNHAAPNSQFVKPSQIAAQEKYFSLIPREAREQLVTRYGVNKDQVPGIWEQPKAEKPSRPVVNQFLKKKKIRPAAVRQ